MENLQNLEIEQQILGLILKEKREFDKIEDLTKAEHFCIPLHQKLFKKITGLRKTKNSDGLILVFLNQCFNEEERQAIVSMINEASTFANIRDYALSLIDLYQKRETLKAFEYFQNSIIEDKYDFATSELLDKIAKLDNENQDNAKISTPADTEKEIESETKEDLHLPTGFKKLDKVFSGGLKKKTLTVLGARPRVGKTSWCQQVILNIAKQGKVCLFASLEVSNKQVYDKFVSINKSIPAWKIARKKLNQAELIDYNISKQELKEINDFIFVLDASQSIKQIEAMVKRHIAKRKLDLLVVDYIQIVKRAIEEPLRQIVINSGIEGSIVVQKIKEGKGDFGFNARTEVYENLFKAGVIDPTKVTRVALENAASIAAMLLTTECVIADKPKPEAAAGHSHGAPDMGGMGY